MPFVKADNKILYIKLNGSFVPVACLSSDSFSEGSETLDTTTRDNNGYKTSVPTNQFYTISFEGIKEDVDLSDDKLQYFSLMDYKRNRTLIDWRISGDSVNYDYGQGYIIDLSSNSPAGDLVTYSASIEGFGKPKNLLKEIYDQWETALLSESQGIVSSKQCVLNQINNIL